MTTSAEHSIARKAARRALLRKHAVTALDVRKAKRASLIEQRSKS
jgi:hypothetical protein